MKPEDSLKKLLEIEKQLRLAKKYSVDIGLIADKVGDKVYGDGQSVLEVGFSHEYGVGQKHKRSFIRMPVKVHHKDIGKFILKEFEKISEGKQTAEKAIGRIGVKVTNIIKGAFRTNGYGNWEPDSAYTIERKGSSQTLVDTGMLRNSITWRINT